MVFKDTLHCTTMHSCILIILYADFFFYCSHPCSLLLPETDCWSTVSELRILPDCWHVSHPGHKPGLVLWLQLSGYYEHPKVLYKQFSWISNKMLDVMSDLIICYVRADYEAVASPWWSVVDLICKNGISELTWRQLVRHVCLYHTHMSHGEKEIGRLLPHAIMLMLSRAQSKIWKINK